ncbi:MAG TPA: ABC transporter ATP-binding protein [Candidatus Binatia bacterium]|nr:ABC transporter ATP-binding protein [Candidatus Binatia bacterium]
MDGPAISIQGLTKRFGKSTALDALDLEVAHGACLGILGPAGSGKSTLLRVVCGLARASGGAVTVAGERVRAGDGLAARRQLGYVPQEPGLPEWMTAREVLAFLADLSGVEGPDMTPRIDDTARQLVLADVLDRRVEDLPAPVRGRLGIAQALVADPYVLLLDEPFHWLDPEARVAARALLDRLRGRRTVVLATHRLADVEGLCDQVAVLDEGRFRFVGETRHFLEAYAPPVFVLELQATGGLAIEGVVARLGREPWAGEVKVIGTTLRVAVRDEARAARELLPAVIGTGVAIAGVRRARPALDAILAGLPPAAKRGASA